MHRDGSAKMGPYHEGELDIQRRAGVVEEARRLARGVSPALTADAARLMAGYRMAVAASLDQDGRVWASVLTGPAGFLLPVDQKLMLVAAHPHAHDPLASNLAARNELGLLAIDLAARRRLRFNGRALLDPERGIFLSLDQVYGNCPKYIQARRVEALEPSGSGPSPVRSGAPDARQRAWIGSADTFFIGSFHPEGGADASHRGGAPGFVRMNGERSLVFGDYPGNNMFNTLGNLAVQPRAGLLFLDFENGATLQLTGRALLDRDPGKVASFRGARGVVVSFEIEEVLEVSGAGVRGRLLEPSPFNP